MVFKQIFIVAEFLNSVAGFLSLFWEDLLTKQRCCCCLHCAIGTLKLIAI